MSNTTLDWTNKLRGDHSEWWFKFRKQVKSIILNKTNLPNARVIRGTNARSKKVGLYGFGTCHTRSLLHCKPFIEPVLTGTCGILYEGKITNARSDIMVQSLKGVPAEDVSETIANFDLAPWYFQPRLFEDRFHITGFGEFPKSVIGLSLAPDVMRPAYRHKKHGFLFDPGGYWLNRPKEEILQNLDKVKWFRQNFENVGRIDVETFKESFKQVVLAIRERTQAQIIMMNTLTVIPDNQLYNYQGLSDHMALRQRIFSIALFELSQDLDFPIVDLDRILKQEGVRGQIDYAHWSYDKWAPISREITRILQDYRII